MALSGLGLVDTIAGEYERAERELAEARELFRQAADRWALTQALWNTADLQIALGKLDAADAAPDEALRVAAETGRDRWVAQTIARLADTALLRGDRARAEVLLTEARDLYAFTRDEIGAAQLAARLETVNGSLSERI